MLVLWMLTMTLRINRAAMHCTAYVDTPDCHGLRLCCGPDHSRASSWLSFLLSCFVHGVSPLVRCKTQGSVN